MLYLKFKENERTKEAVDYFFYKGKNRVAHKGCGTQKQTFVSGFGYISTPKKLKQAEPLPESYNSQDIINKYQEYGEEVTLELIAKGYNNNDCKYYQYSYELANILNFGKSYDQFINLARVIDINVIEKLNKYGIIVEGDWAKLKTENDTVYLNSVYENFMTGKISSHYTWRPHLFSNNICLSIINLGPSKAFYDCVSHEKNLKLLLYYLSYKHALVNNFLVKSEDDYNTFYKMIENMSVKDYITTLYGTDIADKAEALNKFELIETDVFKV